MKSMEKSSSEEMAMIFRQLSPINQRYFLMMVQVADVAEKNAGRKNWTQMEPGQGNREVQVSLPVCHEKRSTKDVRILWKWNRAYGKGAGLSVGQTEYNA